MSILNRVLNVFVGDKSRKDLKSIQPIVSQILAEEKKLSDISNDELRTKTKEFKDQIQDIRSLQKKINTLLVQIDRSYDIDNKESLYSEIDALNEELKIKFHLFSIKFYHQHFQLSKKLPNDLPTIQKLRLQQMPLTEKFQPQKLM